MLQGTHPAIEFLVGSEILVIILTAAWIIWVIFRRPKPQPVPIVVSAQTLRYIRVMQEAAKNLGLSAAQTEKMLGDFGKAGIKLKDIQPRGMKHE